MRIIISIIILLVLPTFAFSTTLNVPSQYPTIQAAIDAAAAGDTVLVDDGTYVENIDFKGKAITVTSVNGVEATVIDGGKPVNPDFGSVVIFQSQEGPDSVLKGFTIENGTGTIDPGTSYYYGGGIYVGGVFSPTSASPTILDNRIKNNSASDGGGGICAAYGSCPDIIGNTVSGNSALNAAGIVVYDHSSPAIRDCIIEANTATDECGGVGGGSYCSPLIEGCIIRDNKADVYCGGVEFFDHSAPIIRNNCITGNEAVNNGGGGVLMTLYCSGLVENNIIAFNTAKGSTYSGAGITIDRYSDTVVMNNTIYGNSAEYGGGIDIIHDSTPSIINNTVFGNSAKNYGGGMRVNTNCQPVVTNTIFWDNTLVTGAYGPEMWIGNSSKVAISHSDVDGGQSSCWVAPNSKLVWGAGMIDADPLFVDASGEDYHIRHDSPCRDTGDSSVPGLPSGDFEGDPRIAYGAADMGADEHFRHLYTMGDAMPGGNVKVHLTGVPGMTPVGLIAGFGVYDPPLSSMWGDWYVMFPWVGPIDLGSMPSPGGVMTINGQIPGSPPGPYSVYLQAIIGAELTNLSVMEVE